MAELCRKCFIEIWRPSQYDIDHIVMSEDNDMCEGCMSWGHYVDHIEDSHSEHAKKLATIERDEWCQTLDGNCVQCKFQDDCDWKNN